MTDVTIAEELGDKAEPTRRPKKVTVSTEDKLRGALKNMLDNTAPDATPRGVRQQAEEALAGK